MQATHINADAGERLTALEAAQRKAADLCGVSVRLHGADWHRDVAQALVYAREDHRRAVQSFDEVVTLLDELLKNPRSETTAGRLAQIVSQWTHRPLGETMRLMKEMLCQRLT